MSPVKLIWLTLSCLVAFAANSVLGRMALKPSDVVLIDPASYSAIRIACGAVALFLVQRLRNRAGQNVTDERRPASFRRWVPPVALFVYAVCFSFAYIQLDAAAGTLILFASVQFTMLAAAILRSERPRTIEYLGTAVAFGGLIFLKLPSLTAASLPKEALLMAAAGMAWGIYSIAGRGSKDPIADTASNFALATPLTLALCVVMFRQVQLTWPGLALATASGALTSGIGYVLWYTVLPHLSSVQAAAVQMGVPIVAGLGGVIFAHDPLTARTMASGTIILAGIGLTVPWNSSIRRKRTSDSSKATG